MSVQTTYDDNIAAAVAGQIANMEDSNLIYRTVETSAGAGFGVAVTQGTADDGCIVFAGSGDVLGITARDRSVDPNDPDKFAQYDSARIMTKGVIWVAAAEAVDAGETVYVESDGTFTGTETSTATAISNSRWDTSTTGSALAKARLG